VARKNQKEINEQIEVLRPKLKDLEKFINDNKPEKLQEYFSFSLELLNGFNLIGENGNPDTWRHCVGTDIYNFYKWLIEIEDFSDKNLLISIKTICGNIFELSYDRNIEFEKDAPNFTFYSEEEEQKVRTKYTTLSINLIGLVYFIIYCLGHNKIYTGKFFLFDKCEWESLFLNVIPLYMGLFLLNEFRKIISDIVRYIILRFYKIRRRFFWYKFLFSQKIKIWFRNNIENIIIIFFICLIILIIFFLERN
jgi:hypothetical protein